MKLFFSNESRWQFWYFRARLSHTSSQTPLTSPYQTKGRDGDDDYGVVCEKISNNLCNRNFSSRYLCCDPSSQQTVSYENINMDHISGELNTNGRKKCSFISFGKRLKISQFYKIIPSWAMSVIHCVLMTTTRSLQWGLQQAGSGKRTFRILPIKFWG